MISWILSQPFWLTAAFLTAVAAVRSQCTYWAGRAVRAGLLHGAWAARLDNDRVRAAIARLERWGWPLVPISFLTVGFQTAINLSAGLIGWRWAVYTAAAVPGWVAWGTVYAAGGLAIFAGIASAAAHSPWLVALVLAVVAGLVVLLVWRRHRAAATAAAEPVTAACD